MSTKQANMFDRLPLELVLEIASSLETDSEITRFRSVGSSIRDAIECNGHYFWRRLFATRFDASRFAGTPGYNNSSYMEDYQARRTWLKKGANFKAGRTMEERRCLEILLDLILDANSNRRTAPKSLKRGKYTSHNILALVDFVKKDNVTFNPNLTTLANPLLEIVQVMLAPIMFDISMKPSIPVTGFLTSQSVAYATVKSRPIILGGIDVDLDWALHQVNFWRHHLLDHGESSLFLEYEELHTSRRPRFWTEQLQSKRKPDVGKFWKSSFANVAYVDLPVVRAGNGSSAVDEFSAAPDRGMIIDLVLSLDTCEEPGWAEYFEEHLHVFPQPTASISNGRQNMPRSIEVHDFYGSELIGKGWLTSLPPQEDVPGWQRITFMQHIKNKAGTTTDWICAYEGVVLPGGQIILGRWNVPGDMDEESGPFIMWSQDAIRTDDVLPEDAASAALDPSDSGSSQEEDDNETTSDTEDGTTEHGSDSEQESQSGSEESSSEYEP